MQIKAFVGSPSDRDNSDYWWPVVCFGEQPTTMVVSRNVLAPVDATNASYRRCLRVAGGFGRPEEA